MGSTVVTPCLHVPLDQHNERESCFFFSSEKRPVVSLMEDEAKPNVSVFNIFKQVKWLFSHNNTWYTHVQNAANRSWYDVLTNFPSYYQIKWTSNNCRSLLKMFSTFYMYVWDYTGWIVLIMFVSCFVIRSGWWLSRCVSSSPSPSERSQL